MTELSFLIGLLINHKLPRLIQQIIKARLDEIQIEPSIETPQKTQSFSVKPILSPIAAVQNAVPVNEIAQTPAAQAALAHRQALINAALNNKPMPGADSAPKSHGKL